MSNGPKPYQIFFAELKRRHVFKVAAVYSAVAFAVLEAADIVFPRIGLPDWTVTFVVALVAAGLPIAIVLAWAFDSTPGGVKRTDPAASGELEAIVALPRGRRWPTGLLALAAVLMLSGGVWWVLRDGGPSATDAGDSMVAQSVAVLPFVDMSGESEYLGDGMAETLINALTRIEGLQVAARTSAFAFKGKNEDVRVIGEKLGVGAVLEGSVQRAGDRIRVTAQLIDASNGFHLWSNNFDRDVNDVFAVQDEVARAVVEALQIELLEGGGRPIVEQGTRDLAAYNAYLKGRFHWNKRTDQDLIQAATYFEEAIATDSSYALAWAALAETYLLYVPSEYDVTVIRYPTARQWYGTYLLKLGRAEEGLAQLKRAEELDPLSLVIGVEVAELLDAVGRTEEAAAQIEKVLAAHPGAQLATYYGLLHYLMAGDYERVSELAAVAVSEGLWREISPEQIRGLAERLGDPQLRHQELIALAESTPDGELAIAIYRGLGEEDQALAALERVAGDPLLAVGQYIPAIMMTLGPDLARHPRAQAALAALLEGN
jgi:TolB-like protein/tetratricopeptide (TPR) repeat protein